MPKTLNKFHYTNNELDSITIDDLVLLAGQTDFTAVMQGDGEGGIILTITKN
jgi:hypothetical protein